MSFSFRNLFSQGDENSSEAPQEGEEGQVPSFMNNPPQSTSEGNFQAMFDQQGQPGGDQNLPLTGGSGTDPRANTPAQGVEAAQPGGPQMTYLVSELLAFIPPALAAQSGIPMEQSVTIAMPPNGTTDVNLSSVYAACPALFATEITPLNDSVITLPPKLSSGPKAAPAAAPTQNPGFGGGMDISTARESKPAFSNNPFADAVNSPLNGENGGDPNAQPEAGQQPPAAAANPFAQFQESQPQAAHPPAANPTPAAPAPAAEPGSAFGFPAPAPENSPAAAGFSPFGAPPEPAPVAEPASTAPVAANPFAQIPQTQPQAADQAAPEGFSAIGNVPEPTPEPSSGFPSAASGSGGDSLFSAGNPFEEAASQSAEPSAGGFAPAASPATAAQSPAPNPFESNEGFSTIFSEKAEEDASLEAPSSFGSIAPAAETASAAPVANPFGENQVGAIPPSDALPTLDEALPPTPSDSVPQFGNFAPIEESPALQAKSAFPEEPREAPTPPTASAPSPFEAPRQAPAPAEEAPAPAAPSRQPAQANPFSDFAPTPTGQASPFDPISESPATPAEEPAAKPDHQGFAPLTPGEFGQSTPSEEKAPAPAPSPEPAPEPESPAPAPSRGFEAPAPANEAAEAGDDSSDDFDSLSPFTSAIGEKNSFFDELDAAEAAKPAPAPAPTPQPEPEPVAQPLPPAPKDAVVKNIELRAVFGTDEDFNLEGVARKTVALPGISCCAVMTQNGTAQAARAGETTMPNSQVEGLADNARQIAALTGVSDAGAFTMHTDKGLISIFSHESATLAVRHGSGEFDPGIREKLMLVARGVASL